MKYEELKKLHSIITEFTKKVITHKLYMESDEEFTADINAHNDALTKFSSSIDEFLINDVEYGRGLINEENLSIIHKNLERRNIYFFRSSNFDHVMAEYKEEIEKVIHYIFKLRAYY